MNKFYYHDFLILMHIELLLGFIIIAIRLNPNFTQMEKESFSDHSFKNFSGLVWLCLNFCSERSINIILKTG